MIDLRPYQVWFVTGSRHLYGEKTLAEVAEHSRTIVRELAKSSRLPFTSGEGREKA
jgi:L-arabinose isomerase